MSDIYIEEVLACHRRLCDAGGLLEIAIIEEDYNQATLRRAAKFVVIEGVRYWECLHLPNIDGLPHKPPVEDDYSWFC